MQSCTVTPGDARGKHRGVPFRSENGRSSIDGCCSLPDLRPSSSSLVFPSDATVYDTTHLSESFLMVTKDVVPVSRDTFLTGIGKADTAARNHSTGINHLLSATSAVPDKSSTECSSENAIHNDGSSMQSSPVHLNGINAHGCVSAMHTHVADVDNTASVCYDIPSSGGYAQGKEAYGSNDDVRDISLSRQVDDSGRREGLLFFCSSDKYTNKAGSSTAESNDVADREESLQPRNFFPFNNLLAAAGWGSGGGWFFNNGSPFTTADSSDVTPGQAGTDTVVEAPGVVYLPQLPAMPPSRKVLPPLLSIGKVAGAQNNIAGEEKSTQQHGTTVSRPAVDGSVVLTSPWHQQERRHREQTCLKFKRRRVDVLARGPLSSRNVGLQRRTSVSRLQYSAGTGAIGSSRCSSICQWTKSVGNVLWSCLCKLLRSRCSFVSSSAAAAAAANKAAKKISRVPGVFQFFEDNAVGLALQDFSVRDVVKQWFSSLLLSEKQSGEKPVFLGPARANRCRRGAAAVPEKHVSEENSVDSAPTESSPACAADAHIFITPEAGRLLWRSACSLIVNPVTAMYFQCYRLASLGTVVYVTSVMHWWQPQLGIRRTLDVLAVCIVSGIHVIVACVHAAPPVLLLYMLLCCTGVVCYLIGCSLAFQGLHAEAAVCHVGLHSLCSVANLLLYYTIAA